VNQKLLKKFKSNDETLAMLKLYSVNQENIIRKIASANQNKQLFKIVLDWMN